MAAIARQPSTVPDPPNGGSWSTYSGATSSSSTDTSSSVNNRSMNSLTIFLLSVVIGPACAPRRTTGTPTSLGVWRPPFAAVLEQRDQIAYLSPVRWGDPDTTALGPEHPNAAVD